MAQIAVVTGASGFIASQLVASLLQKGYTVRATVRSKSNPSKYDHLTKLADALPGRLELFEASLTESGSFDAAVRGANFVYHVASPTTFVADDPQKDIVDPAVDGTLNVLRAVLKSKDTVKRTVITSSTAALTNTSFSASVPKNGATFTDADWNREAALPDGAYAVSKVKAEEAAREFAKKEGLDVVAVNPGLVLPPAVSTAHKGAFSIEWFKSLLETGAPANAYQYPFQVDVRDLAQLHILAAETPAASGRYPIGRVAPDLSTAFEWLEASYPEFDFSSTERKNLSKPYGIDNSKTEKDLGFTYTPFKETYLDAARTFIQLGIAQPRIKK